MSEELLTVSELSATASEHVLLDGIELTLRPGEVFAVIGKSGSGKTTLGLGLQGEHRPGITLSGSVRLRGVELLSRPDAQRRHVRASTISYLPQHPASVLNPVRRIGNVLRELAGIRHDSRSARQDAVFEALETAQLPADRRLLRRFAHQLSGGQQQRVALAQALITKPEIVVLDEPTAGLDTTTKSDTAEMLTNLVAGGTALVLLTHDLGLARQLADEVAVMRDGRLVEHGPGQTPLRTPSHPHAMELLAAEPHLPTTDERGAPEEAATRMRARALRRTTADGTTILDNVDLSVGHGECVAIVGRSGAGKTTLGRCLAGLSQPDSGHVAVNGTKLPARMSARTREQRRWIQYVHQDARASFDEYRSVTAQVARTARLLRDLPVAQARHEASEMLRVLGLDPDQTVRRPDGLSGGQLQRAALARALLARPEVLVCDEITSALDVVNQAELLETLNTIKSTMDTSMILVSHDFTAVSALADKVHVLDEGRCAESATVSELFAAAKSPAGSSLVAAARRSAGELAHRTGSRA